jgi:pimeloyl-ACP methyl ester carboxylesterase
MNVGQGRGCASRDAANLVSSSPIAPDITPSVTSPPSVTPGERSSRVATLSGGRRIGYADWGDPAGRPFLFFHGTPASRLAVDWADTDAAERGVRLLSLDRPGHGLSDPAPGRSLLDWTRDVDGFADALGLDRFAIAGWSGGGPYALACAYALRDRLTDAFVLSGCGPLDTGIARRSSSMFDRTLLAMSVRAPRAAKLVLRPAVFAARRTPRLAAKSAEQDLSPTDLEVFRRLHPDPQRAMAFFVEAFRNGSAGVVDDYRVLASPWGFEPEQIEFPVRFWHGDDDRIVVIADARAVAQRMPNATFTTVPGEGHMMLMAHFDDFLEAMTP